MRKAFSHAVDREALLNTFPTLSRAATRGGAIPPAMPAHSHRVGAEYDLEKARELLAEAGYPGGKGLPEIHLVVPHWLQPLDEIAELWKPIGARVRVTSVREHVDWDVIADADMWWTGWTADYPDPDGFFRGLLTHGWPFYCDDDILELLASGRSLRDQGERMRVYHEVDHLWVGEHAAILPSATRAPSSSAGRGSRACGRARSPGPTWTRSWSGSAARPRPRTSQPSGNGRGVAVGFLGEIALVGGVSLLEASRSST